MSSILEEMYKHNLWANLRLIDACAPLGEEHLDAESPGAYGKVRDTLVHLVGAEQRYVARINGVDPERPVRETESFPGFEVLREQAQKSGEALIVIARETHSDHIVRGTWRGEPFALPVSTLLIQAINHATEHRTNITTVLAQRGIEPPDIDGWAYNEALAKG